MYLCRNLYIPMQEISIKTMINIKKILLSAAFVALGGISVLATSKRKEPATPAPSTIYWNDVYGKVYYSKNANVSPVVKIALNMFSDDMKAILGYPAKRNQMPTFRFTSSTCFPTRSFLPSRSLEFRSTSLSARKMHSGLVPVRANHRRGKQRQRNSLRHHGTLQSGWCFTLDQLLSCGSIAEEVSLPYRRI